MNNNIVANEIINFNDIEKEVFGFVCSIGVSMIRDMLEKLDEELCNGRNKREYRYKFKSEKTIQTVMGDITFNRRYYIHRYTKQGVYLLDKALELNLVGRTSVNLIIKMIDNALRNSYRESANDININTNTSTSHQTIKNKVDFVGEKIKKLENQRMAKYIKGELEGEKQIDVLFEEKDGIFLKIQGKQNKQELKLAKVYEGWKENNNAFSTVGTMYFAGYEEGEVFDNLINSWIAQKYRDEKIKYKILNGDAAPWISAELGLDSRMIYQLDLFHIYQKASRKIKDKNDREIVKKLIKKKEYDKVLEKVKELMDNAQDEKIKENLSQLYTYYKNNFEALPRYTDQENVDIPHPPEGIEYRNLGTMEGSIRNVLANRMKNNGMSWSIKGADNLSKLLCLKHSKVTSHQDKIKEIIMDKQKINIIDIKQVLKKLYNDTKIAVNKEVKKAIKEMKSKKKYKCKEGNILYASGKVTRTSTILKELSSYKLVSNLI